MSSIAIDASHRDQHQYLRTRETNRDAYANADVTGECKYVLDFIFGRGDHGETGHAAVATLEILVEIATPTVNRLDKNRLLHGSGGRRLTRTGRQVSAMEGNGHAQH